MSNYGTTNRISPSGIKFIIKNITSARISVLNIKLNPQQQYDLFTSPSLSEDDIKTSLVKGELLSRLQRNEIVILDSTLPLVINDPTFRNFLISKGMPVTSVEEEGSITVSNLAALVSTANPGSFAMVQVQTNLSYYTFDPLASLPVDGVSIINPSSGAGQWIRQRWGNEQWRYQSAWYVDPVSGNDEATGADSGNAIKTIKELSYRLGGVIIQLTQIYILNDIPAGDSIGLLNLTTEWNKSLTPSTPPWVSGTSPSLIIIGTPVTARAGTISAASLAIPASNLAGSVADTSVADWTTDVGKVLIVTSGAAVGSFCWIMKDLGSNTARVSRWSTSLFNNASTLPTAGDTYKIATMTQLLDDTLPTLTAGGTNTQSLNDVQIVYFDYITSSPRPYATAGFKYLFQMCRFRTSVNINSNRTDFRQCYFPAFNLTGATGIDITGCAFTGQLLSSGSSFGCADSVHQNASFVGQSSSSITASNLGIFDTFQPILVENGSFFAPSVSLYGSNNTGNGTAVFRGGRINFNTLFTPTLSTSGVELIIDNRQQAFPIPSAGGNFPNPLTMNTWAIWAAAPFSGFASGMATGATVGTTTAPALTSGLQSSGTVSVATIAALQALTNPGANNVVYAYVQSNKSYWIYENASSATADSILVVSPNAGSGRWLRTTWGHFSHRAQASWFIDPVNGSDGYAGTTSGAPLLTIKELTARLGTTINRGFTVTLLNNIISTDPLSQLNFLSQWDNTLSAATPTITIIGTQTVSRSGTVTTAAVPVPASNLASQIQDTGVVSWTTDVGKLLVMTSGTSNGAMAWVLKDIGSNTARLSRWYNSAFSAVAPTPSPGDTYNIVTFTQAGNNLPNLPNGESNTNAIVIRNIEFTATLNPSRDVGLQLSFQGCKFSGAFTNNGKNTLASACLFAASVNDTQSTSFMQVNSCASLTVTDSFTVAGSAIFNDFVSQGGQVSINAGATVQATNLSIFDFAGIGLTIRNSTLEVLTSLYGNGNTQGVEVRFAGKLRIVGGFTPTLTGTTEVQLEASATAIPPLTAGASVPAASALTTWAQWAASPFSGNVMSYKSGASIFAG